MSKVKTTNFNYKIKREELDDILRKLESEDIDIDKAIKLYKLGQELIIELESYLKTAENTVNVLKAKFDNNSI